VQTYTPTRRTLVTVGIASGVFLSSLDTTIIGTAMPTVIASLGGTELYTWVFAAYMLTSTTATPIFGKLSDLFGQRMLFAASIVLLLLGSALSGSAQTMPQLITFRALQGIGGGGLMAMAFTIIGHVFSPTERPRMQGITSAVWAISAVVGPAVGGSIVDYLNWRWAFYVNIPIGIVPAMLILSNLKDVRRHGEKPTIDFVGASCLISSITFLLLALLQGSTGDWNSSAIFGLFAVAAILLAIFIWNEGRTREPIVPLSLFRLRTFSVCNMENLLTGAALFGITGFIPLFVQGVLRGSATVAGMALMPLSIGWPIGSIAGGYLVNRLGYRNVGTAGTASMAIGFYLLTMMGIESTAVTVGRNMFVVGLAMGLLTPTVTAAIQNSVSRAHMGVASSSVAFYRNIGGTVGVSVMGAILNSQMAFWASRLLDPGITDHVPIAASTNFHDPQILLNPELSKALPDTVVTALGQSLSNSLHTVFITSLSMLLVGLAVSALMPNSTPTRDVQGMSPRV